ncbi:MAG: hypothetical protein Q9160_004650 [Pyrenula sp. 1 TL-2023]
MAHLTVPDLHPAGPPFLTANQKIEHTRRKHSLNNENTEPSTPERGLSPYHGKECVTQKTASSPAISSPPWTDRISATNPSSSDRNVASPPNDTSTIKISPILPQQPSRALKPHRATTEKVKETPPDKEPKPSPESTPKEPEDIVPSQFSKWADSFRKRKSGMAWANTRNQRERVARNINLYESSLYNRTFPLRRSRFRRSTSFSSSGFVETVRTASLSTTSFALIPRSLRDSQLSDGNGYCDSVKSISHARFSSESNRHQNISSNDEGAQHRATKRRHILDELLSSEESYIADLKVLTNLFSTILTSLPSVSSRMRSSIQHNAMTILHLHEIFANGLHQAARKHATTTVDLVVRRKQDFHRHTKWHSLDHHAARATELHTETTRNSFDVPQQSPAVLHQPTRAPIAQGSEVAEVARMVKHLVSHFFAYEEYCSKYDTMVHEIGNSHKVFPSWTAYALGVEALARSMSALDARIEDQRKGLTVGDLLIKPLGPVYGDADSFSRRLSIQRAATVGTRSGLCQVIIRNTVNLTEGEEQRNETEHVINRSQSVLTTHRVGVLSPKRSERIRLEHCLSDVWSRDIIPFPGMTVSRSGNIIRASAGSLVRRLSRASMHGPFSRRSTSITVIPSKPSCEDNPDPQRDQLLANPPSQLRSPEAHRRTKSNTENNRLIHDSHSSEEHRVEPRRMSTGAARLPRPHHNVDRAQSVKAFLGTDGRKACEREIVEEKLEGKKRWSNPLGLLRHISTDSVRHLLYSSKAT